MSRFSSPRAFSLLQIAAMFVAVLAGASAAIAVAVPPGIDLVILIDQSGSMWGHPEYHPDANDKYAHRIGAARAVLERLASDVQGSERVHRFSVVDFGDEVEVAWSNQVLRYDPADPTALRRRLDVELPRRVVARQWGNTNTPEALSVALSELRKMDASEPMPGRRRVVLLITDGRAQRPPASLDMMRQRSRVQARNLLASGGELWVVALNDASAYWLEGDGAFWQNVVGDPLRTYLAERAVPDLPRGVNDMVDKWLDLPPRKPTPGPGYTAPPYLGQLAFRVTFDKPSDPSTVQIKAPDGRVLARVSAGSGGSPSTYARFALDDPPPGQYTYESLGVSPLIEPEPHPPAIYRLVPEDGTDLDVETRVVYRVALGSGRPLELLSAAPIRAVVEVQAPDGSQVELAATFEGEGKFVSRWRPTVPGSHRLSLRGSVEIDGETVDVFARASAAETVVDVSTARPVWLRLDRPSPESGLRATPWATQAEVRLTLVDGDDEQVDPRGLVTDLEGWLQLERLDASGVALGDPVPLELDDKGRFQATLPIEPNWRGSPGLLGLGDLYLRVRAEAGRLPEDRVLRAIAMPESLEDRRLEGDPLSAGPIPIQLSYWIVSVALVGALLVVLGVMTLVGARLIPAWRIAQADRRKGPLTLRVYDLKSDPSASAAQPLRITGGVSFKFDGQVRLTFDGETKIADRFRVTRLDSPGRRRARLAYRWLGEKKAQEILLTAGSGPKMLKIEAAIMGQPVAELVDG